MINELTKAIKAHLTKALEQFVLRVPSARGAGEYAPPAVFLGALPPKLRPDEPEGFPYLVVRATGGEIEQEGEFIFETVEVALICGVYSAEGVEAGEQEVINLARACLAALHRVRTLGGRFELLSLSWFKPEEQNPPYYQARVETRWRFLEPPAGLGPEMEIETYGSGYQA